jgi:hypothetical protein
MLHHISTADLLVAAFLTSLVLIVIVAAYLDFRSPKTFRSETGFRPSRDEFLTRSRTKTL